MKKYILFILFSSIGLSQEITSPIEYNNVSGVNVIDQQVNITTTSTTTGVKSTNSSGKMANQAINMSGTGSLTGLGLYNNSDFTFSGNTTINTSSSNSNSNGVLLRGKSKVTGDSFSITTSGNKDSYGIRSEQSQFDAKSVDITSQSYGILIMGGSFSSQNTNIKSENIAVNAQYGSTVNVGENGNLETQNGNGTIWSLQDSNVIGSNINIISKNNTIGLLAQTGNINLNNSSIYSENGVAVYAFDSTSSPTYKTAITLKNDIRGEIYSLNSASIASYGKESFVNVDNANISNGSLSTPLIISQMGSKINISNSDLNTTSGNNAIVAKTGSMINVSGISNINGNILVSGNSAINLDLDNSVFNGNSTIESGIIDLVLKNSVWNMTDNSQVSNLTLNNSTVNFKNDNFTTLTTDTLQGNGIFNMRTDIVGQQGDLLVVNGTANGNYKLNIANSGSSNTTGTETLTVVKTGANNANFTLANHVELGAYEYGLRSATNSATNIELYSTGKVTSTAQAATSFLNINYLTTYIENQTLMQRLGDLRNSDNGNNGLWIREFGGKASSFSGSGLKGFDMTYTGTQLGVDKGLDVDSGRWVVGVMAGLTRTNPNYKAGNGNGENYTLGLYATYLDNSGFYVDNVIKYNNMHNRFSVKDTQGSGVNGKSRTSGFSLSSELGKRFWLSDKTDGLYIEPQAQLTYSYNSGDSLTGSNGLRVNLSHYNSTIGRISGIVGYKIEGNNPVDIYIKTGVVREFDGKTSYRYNGGIKNNYNFKSTWFDNGIGANININKKHNIYAEADYSTGGKFDNAMLNLGYRYSF